MNNYITPEDFGARADGVFDSAPALQAAIDNAITTGRDLRLRPGVYRCASQLDAVLGDSKKISIIGVGGNQGAAANPQGGSTFLFNGATGGLSISTVAGSTTGSLSSRSYYHLEGFQISGSIINGIGLEIGRNNQQIDTFALINNVSDVVVHGNWLDCIRLTNARQFSASNSMFYNSGNQSAATAMRIVCDAPSPGKFCGDLHMVGCNLFANPAVAFTKGILIEANNGDIAGLHFSDTIIYEGVVGVYYFSTNGGRIYDTWFTSCAIDGPGSITNPLSRGVVLDMTATGLFINNTNITNLYCVGKYEAINLNQAVGTGIIRFTNISNGYFGPCAGPGVTVNNTGNLKIRGTSFENCSNVTANAPILLAGAVYGTHITDNVVSGNYSPNIVRVQAGATLSASVVRNNIGDITTTTPVDSTGATVTNSSIGDNLVF